MWMVSVFRANHKLFFVQNNTLAPVTHKRSTQVKSALLGHSVIAWRYTMWLIHWQHSHKYVFFFPLREPKMNLCQDDTFIQLWIYTKDQTINLWFRKSTGLTLWYVSAHECSSLVRLCERNTKPRTESFILNTSVVENHVSLCLKASR